MEIVLNEKVHEQLRWVKLRCGYNMLNYAEVVSKAYSLGFRELGSWILDNKQDYLRGLFLGFEVKEECI